MTDHKNRQMELDEKREHSRHVRYFWVVVILALLVGFIEAATAHNNKFTGWQPNLTKGEI